MTVNKFGGVRFVVGNTNLGFMASSAVSGTLYYVKWHYKKGTLNNAIASCELSTTGTWSGSGGFFLSTTTGDCTINMGAFQAFSFTDGDYRLDHIRVSTTDLGNSFSSWI